MPEQQQRRRARRPGRFVLIAVLVAALVAVAAVLLERELNGPPEADRPSSPPPRPSSSDSGGGHAGSAGRVPFSSVQEIAMSFPGKERTQPRSVAVEGGQTYLVRFEAEAEKPAGTPGSQFMLGVRMTCADTTGKEVVNIGATQNLLTGEPVALVNQAALTPRNDDTITCELLANSPDAKAASRGTRYSVGVTWGITEPVGRVFDLQPARELPLVIDSGEQQSLFVQDIDVKSLTQRQLDLLTTVQMTSCTGTGGSREAGTTWCTKDNIDATGSHFRFEPRFDVLDADGHVCRALSPGGREEYLNTFVHHRAYHIEKSVWVPAGLCGDRIRVSVNVTGRGPAGLLIHDEGTTAIVHETRPPR